MPLENQSNQTHLVFLCCIKHLCIFGPKGAIQICYYYYYYYYWLADCLTPADLLIYTRIVARQMIPLLRGQRQTHCPSAGTAESQMRSPLSWGIGRAATL